MEYNTKEDCNKFETCPGDRFVIEYEPTVEPNGRITIHPVGKKDLFQEIQSWRDQTDMHYILQQMELGLYQGRESVTYGDFTEAPENMQQAMQIMLNAERAFYDLPLEVRKRFDNDYRQWMVMASSDYSKFGELMGFDKYPEQIQIEEMIGDDKE